MNDDNKPSLPGFQALEKDAIKELSLEILKSTLVHSFKKLHQEQLEIFEDKLADLEENLGDKIQAAIAKQMRQQLKETFQDILDTCQTRIWLLVAPLIKRSEDDVKRLEKAVAQTEDLCQRIQQKYRLRWEWPFLSLILATTLTGGITGLVVFVWSWRMLLRMSL